MDIEKLLSPTGGYNYGNTINTGAAGLGMAFMSGPLFDSFVMKPASHAMGAQIGREYGKNQVTDLDVNREANKARRIGRLEKVRAGRVAAHGPNFLGEAEGSHYDTKIDAARKGKGARGSPKEIREGNRLSRIQRAQVYKAQYKDWTSKFSKGRAVFRAAGWATLISLGVDLAVEANAPGVSKIAAKQDERFMMQQQRMDSPAAFTMRQRAVEAIHNSMMSTRNVMGNEAQFMHR